MIKTSPTVWLTAIRPATLTAAVAPVVVGTALALADGVFVAGPALAAMAGALLIQIGTNLFNDYAPYTRGPPPPAGGAPARVTQKGWMTPTQVATAAAVTFAAAALVGLYLAAVAGWPIVLVGVAGIASGVLYTGGPRPLGYIGLGDVFVMAFFGVAAVCGTYYVQALTVSAAAVLASLAVGALATAILVVNNLRDRFTDARAGKRTLAVRFGARFARAEYLLLVVTAYAVAPLAWGFGIGGPGWMLTALSAPLAVGQIRGVLTADGAALNKHLGGTARLGLVYGALLAVGALL